MPLNIPEHVSSLQTIANSIRYDSQVCRWFLLLVDHPSVRRRILTNFSSEKTTFERLDLIPWLEWLLGFFGLTWMAMAWSFKNYAWLIPLTIIPFAAWWLVIDRRKLIAVVSVKLLELDFPGESLRQKSLYQISEILSRNYSLPSLVDTIFHWDSILRMGSLTSWIIATFIFPLKLWFFYSFIILSMFLLKTLLRARWIYRRFR